MQADTIVARATPPGAGALAVVRLSGPDAIGIVSRLTGKASESFPDRCCVLVRPRRPSGSSRRGELLDVAIAVAFRAPRSYTGEDVVELSVHGGYLVPAEILASCISLGAREAEPGEFTQRAYLNGRIDLTQAEAIADLVASRSPRGKQVALHQLERGLAERIGKLRAKLIEVEAFLVQHVDFPEEDDAPVSISEIRRRTRLLAREIRLLEKTGPQGELLREGALTVLAGPVNAGKSSLFNALLGRERTLVAPDPGTTRDAVEAVVSIDGYPFRLVDVAGLRAGAGKVERMGMQVARAYLKQADVVLYCDPWAESGAGRPGRSFLEDIAAPVLHVRTKWDLAAGSDRPGSGELAASVLGPPGLDQVRSALLSLAFGELAGDRADTPVVTSRRQTALLRQAVGEVDGFDLALKKGVPPEAAAAHLRAAATALEEIVGHVAHEDVLDRVFREFCIGK